MNAYQIRTYLEEAYGWLNDLYNLESTDEMGEQWNKAFVKVINDLDELINEVIQAEDE